MQQQMNQERRGGTRKRMLKGGVIAISARHVTMPCVLRDISDTGARLQVSNGAGVPDTFELIVELDGLAIHAEVVWRRQGEVGVRFLGAPVLEPPRRSQTITSHSAGLAKPSLRRSPTPPASQRFVPRGAGTASPQADAVARARTTGPVPPASIQPTDPAAAIRMPAEPIPAMHALPASAPLAGPMPTAPGATIPILIADDDPDDRLLIGDAFRESNFQHPISFVEDGEELLEYLRAEGRFAGRRLPGLILLDLNMPRMDGRTALMHMKADRSFRRIPVIVLTTSRAEEDIQRTYDLGVSAYMPKPDSYRGILELVQSLNDYWMRFVAVPSI